MSYNTRRNYGNNQANPSPSASVGQRRTGGFVSGGQLAGSQPQYRPQGQQQQQRPAPQQQPANARNQTPRQPFASQASTAQKQQQQAQTGYTPVKQEPQTPVKPVAASTPAKPAAPQQPQTPAQPAVQAPVQPAVVQQQQQQAAANNVVQQQQQQQPAAAPAVAPSVSNPENMEVGDVGNKNGAEGPRKKFWPKGTANKISRAEKARRRNLKLSKILQPKNAVMILNELVKGCEYNVEEVLVKVDHNQFRGTVSFDGLEFAGTGKNKIAAKNSAAETALKHLVKNKKLGTLKKEEDVEKMDTGEEDSQQVMPWSHIASFAMFKLFSAWGEDPSTIKVCEENLQLDSQGNVQNGSNNPVAEPKPAKKMPDNPETLNPLMLMHQMLPGAVWEEVGKTGNPPNIIFQMKVTIGDKSFTGTGSNKKLAKRVAAFSACHELLGVNYPSEVWMPFY